MRALESKRGLVILLILSVLFVSFRAFPVRVDGATIHVPSDYPTIQQAINHASVNDTVLVASGTYHELVLLNKTVHLTGAGSATVLDGQGQGAVVTVTANGATLSGFTIQNAAVYGNAIELLHVKYVNVTGNTINSDLSSGRPSTAGVDLYGSNFSLVEGNMFGRNLYAVNMTFSTGNRVTNNQVTSGTLYGVELTDSFQNLIFQNTLVGGEDGVDLVGSLTRLNNVTRNVIRGESIFGAYLNYHPGLNVFSENTFLLDHFGVDIDNATGNTFYHNSFTCPKIVSTCLFHENYVIPSDKTNDVWDNRSLAGPSGPRGGNYWDNYTGTDGDRDGIGDTNLPWTGLDYHPLMVPFAPVPIVVATITASPTSGVAPFTTSFHPSILGTLKPFVYSWTFGDNSPGNSSDAPIHTFLQPGNYTVKLTVRDSSGTSDTGTINVVVTQSRSPFAYLPYVVVGIVGVAAVGLLLFYRRRRRRRGRRVAGQPARGKIRLL